MKSSSGGALPSLPGTRRENTRGLSAASTPLAPHPALSTYVQRVTIFYDELWESLFSMTRWSVLASTHAYSPDGKRSGKIYDGKSYFFLWSSAVLLACRSECRGKEATDAGLHKNGFRGIIFFLIFSSFRLTFKLFYMWKDAIFSLGIMIMFSNGRKECGL